MLQRIQKNAEDDAWLHKLRNAGMTAEDDFKLVALREFIWRVVHRRRSDDLASNLVKFNNIVTLKDLGINALTVIFDENVQQAVGKDRKNSHPQDGPNQPRTLQDALLDASTTEVDSLTSRMPHAQNQAERLALEEGSGHRIAIPPRSGHPVHSRGSPSSDYGKRRNSLQIPGGSSPTQSHVGSFGAGDHLHPLQHRNSALSLLNKRENKALPEIGTTSANAFGKVDAAHVRDTSRSRQPISPLAVEKQY